MPNPVRWELTDVESFMKILSALDVWNSLIYFMNTSEEMQPTHWIGIIINAKSFPPSSGPKSGRMRYQHWSLGQHFDEKACVRWKKHTKHMGKLVPWNLSRLLLGWFIFHLPTNPSYPIVSFHSTIEDHGRTCYVTLYQATKSKRTPSLCNQFFMSFLFAEKKETSNLWVLQSQVHPENPKRWTFSEGFFFDYIMWTLSTMFHHDPSFLYRCSQVAHISPTGLMVVAFWLDPPRPWRSANVDWGTCSWDRRNQPWKQRGKSYIHCSFSFSCWIEINLLT